MILFLEGFTAALLWAGTGFFLCHVTHRQRGLETDHVGIPDFIPSDWLEPSNTP